MSRGNDVTMVLALNRPCSAFSFEMLCATYSLNKCLLLGEVSQICMRGISRYLGISIKTV